MSSTVKILTVKIKNKMHQAFSYLSHTTEKVLEILQFPITWLCGLGLFVVDAVIGGKIIIYMVVISATIDLICGIAVANKKKEFTLSELMRLTVEKLVIYGLALIVFLCVDAAVEAETGFQVDITSGIVGALITLTEVWSFMASLLIIFPNNPILKMLQKQLTGEIARKLGCEEEEVKQILNASRRKKDLKRDSNGRFIKK